MYLFNKEVYCLRLEYFGGLLINKQNMQKFEISIYDSIFLVGILNSLDVETILIFIFNEHNVSFEPDIETYLHLNIIKKIPDNNKLSKTISENFLKEISEVETFHHLRSPIELTIYPTFSCQLNCKFCFLGQKKFNHIQEHTSQEWLTLISSFKAEGVVSVSILGGEPSLYYDIIPLINGLDNFGIKISLTTNAQNWSDKLFDSIVSSKNLIPIISLESLNAKSNSLSMGENSDPQKAISLIKKLKDHQKPCRINTVFTGQAAEELFSIVDFCVLNDIQKYSLALCFGTDKSLPSIKETNAMGDKIRAYIAEQQYSNFNFTVEGCMLFSSYININGEIVKSEFQKMQYGCECGNTILEILPDGSMYSCAAFISNSDSLGNAFQQDWKTIWHSSKMLQYLRTSVCKDKYCRKCNLYFFCNGGCPAYKLQQKKPLFENFDDRCEIHKILEKEPF